MDENDSQESSATPDISLLRFISRGLELETVVLRENGDTYIQLEKNNELVGRHRLNKAKCCASKSPCIGSIQVAREHQVKYGLPPFVHVSLCYHQVNEFFTKQD